MNKAELFEFDVDKDFTQVRDVCDKILSQSGKVHQIRFSKEAWLSIGQRTDPYAHDSITPFTDAPNLEAGLVGTWAYRSRVILSSEWIFENSGRMTTLPGACYIVFYWRDPVKSTPGTSVDLLALAQQITGP
jgi:hypothetical protein